MREKRASEQATVPLEILQNKHERGEATIEEEAILWKWELERSEHEREIERQLLPCPFCGFPVAVEANTPAYQEGGYDAYNVTCTNRDCKFEHFADYEDSEYLIQWWNRRAKQ